VDWVGRAQDLVTIFLGILIEALPFLLLGVLVSQVLALVMRGDRGLAWLPRGRLASLVSLTGIGMLFPVCECGNVPVARRLVTRGVPVASAVVFLLAAPALNPVVALSTYAAFGDDPALVAYRLGFTFLIAVGVGLLLSLHPRPHELLRRGGQASGAHDPPTAGAGRGRTLYLLATSALSEFAEMGGVLVVGAALAALTQTLVPRRVLLSLGQGPVLSVAVMMAFAVILSVCSTVDAFVALAYAGTFSDGSLTAFLVYGPMIDLKSILLMLTVFSPKAVALVTVLITEAAFLVGVGLNYFGR
jgi:uncharacterized membrane protein YraQ (UPF0718 family)